MCQALKRQGLRAGASLGPVLTLFHDYTSPASAVAVARVRRLSRDAAFPVEVIGFEAIGVEIALPVTEDVDAALKEVAAPAAAEGLTLTRPPRIPPTALAHVVEDIAREHGLDPTWRSAAYEAFWAGGADLSDHATLLGLAADVGLDTEAVSTALTDRVALAAVRRRAAELRGQGVGGVPTLLAHQTLVPGLLSDDDLRALALSG